MNHNLISELYGKGKISNIAAHHLTKIMSSKTNPESVEKHRQSFQRAVGLDVKDVMRKRHALNKKITQEETEINELKRETLKSYISKAKKETNKLHKRSKRAFRRNSTENFRKLYNRDTGTLRAQSRVRGTMETKGGSRKIYHNEETIQEVHPPGPGFESWVKHRKADFKKRYGDERGKRILYATAWKLKNKHPEGIKAHGENTEIREENLTMTVPLFIRFMEFARESAKDDLILHKIAEKATEVQEKTEVLCSTDYKSIVK